MDDNSEYGRHAVLFQRTLNQFPECFKAASSSADFMKVSRWWANRDVFAAACESSTHRHSMQAVQPGIRNKVLLKSLPGRDRKRAQWTDWRHNELHDEFHRMRKPASRYRPRCYSPSPSISCPFPSTQCMRDILCPWGRKWNRTIASTTAESRASRIASTSYNGDKQAKKRLSSQKELLIKRR